MIWTRSLEPTKTDLKVRFFKFFLFLRCRGTMELICLGIFGCMAKKTDLKVPFFLIRTRSQFPINKTVSLLIIKSPPTILLINKIIFNSSFLLIFHNKSFIGELHRYNISANKKKNHIRYFKYKLNIKKRAM